MREEKGMCRMKNKGKKYAMLLVLAVAVAGGYGAARETFAATFACQGRFKNVRKWRLNFVGIRQ